VALHSPDTQLPNWQSIGLGAGGAGAGGAGAGGAGAGGAGAGGAGAGVAGAGAGGAGAGVAGAGAGGAGAGVAGAGAGGAGAGGAVKSCPLKSLIRIFTIKSIRPSLESVVNCEDILLGNSFSSLLINCDSLKPSLFLRYFHKIINKIKINETTTYFKIL
jgi:hypothetical protein